jgi:hypothetical protein
MKVCPYYNRNQCEITENSKDVTDSGKAICPKHKSPLVDEEIKIQETQKIDLETSILTDESIKPSIDQDLVCSRDKNHDWKTSGSPNKCFCGNELISSVEKDVFVKNTTNPEELNSIITITCAGNRYEASKFPITIGRESCFNEKLRIYLLANCDGVSRNHIEIDEVDDKYKVREPNTSTNGTFVNDIRITNNWVELKFPCKIELGSVNNKGISIEVNYGS